MSLSGSDDSRCSSWATMRLATWSSTAEPRKTMRSLSSREKMSYSRSPRAVRSMTMGTKGMAGDPTSLEGRDSRALVDRPDEALRRRLPRPRGLRPRGARGRVLRAARAQRGGQDDADQRGLQPHPRDRGRRARVRPRARHDGGAQAHRAGRAGRQPRPLPRRRGDAALPRRLLRHAARGGAPPGVGDDGRLRPAREGHDARAQALGRHAPAPAAGAGAHARAAPGHPRRADRRGRRRAADGAVALHAPPARRGHHGAADHALPRGGRGAVRGDRADPRRPSHRARHRGRPARGVRRDVADRRLRQGDGRVDATVRRPGPAGTKPSVTIDRNWALVWATAALASTGSGTATASARTRAASRPLPVRIAIAPIAPEQLSLTGRVDVDLHATRTTRVRAAVSFVSGSVTVRLYGRRATVAG